MKKYFMKETGNEVQFGDKIELDFSRTVNGKTEVEHIAGIFCEGLVPILKRKGLLIEKEVGEEEFDLIQRLLDSLDKLLVMDEELEKRVTALEEEVSKLLDNGKKPRK